MRARYLVGADGGRSFVRHALDVGFPGETLGVRAMSPIVELEGIGRDAWHRFGDGGRSRSRCARSPARDLFQLQAPVPLEGDVDLSAGD